MQKKEAGISHFCRLSGVTSAAQFSGSDGRGEGRHEIGALIQVSDTTGHDLSEHIPQLFATGRNRYARCSESGTLHHGSPWPAHQRNANLYLMTRPSELDAD